MDSEKLKGVSPAKRKDGQTYYRSSFTYKEKHISLGSFDTPKEAAEAYQEAKRLLLDTSLSIHHYSEHCVLTFEKWVSLINLRDNHIYFAHPIYIRPHMFYYYLSPDEVLKFDADDLFYYSSHKIMKRGNHLFVADYGMQVNIVNRYGIKNHAVLGKDYRFVNGDPTDFRYSNIEILNCYQGVEHVLHKGKPMYKASINVPGKYRIGIYKSMEEAAIAYNKAADILKDKGCPKEFTVNFIDNISAKEYAEIYTRVAVSRRLQELPAFKS